jgi:predicted TIM-barrel fold metal-dependent hydrolase
MHLRIGLLVFSALTWLSIPSTQPAAPPPIIDVHLHAQAANEMGPPPLGICAPSTEMPSWDPSTPFVQLFGELLKKPPCSDPIWSPKTDDELMNQSVAIVRRRNIYAVLGGTPEYVARWMKAAPGRFYPGLNFTADAQAPTPNELRTMVSEGRLAVLAEVVNQYEGIEPSDPRMEPYWALAEELQIPVGIHVGTGPPGAIYLGAKNYRARLHSAMTLEEVLVRHPRLRVYIMHAGFPLLDDLLAVMYSHPQVYVDVGIISYYQPRAAFYRYLQGIVEAGYVKRVLFGSDQMIWPEAIERAIRSIEQAPFLSSEQKRDILYNNAARFLRLSAAEIARHQKG